jgi:thiamine-monophosphate kinase
MNEFDLIEKYFAPLSRDGLKDDAATLSVPGGHELVVSSDTLNAGTHFLENAAPADIAHKALRSNLSDLAAMAAQPLAYQLNLAFPEKPSEKFLKDFTGALAEDQKEFGIFCSGGDTTSINGSLSISITVMGVIPGGKAPKRGGAKEDDVVILTGPVGDAFIGLQILRGKIETGDDDYFIEKYYRPRPRLDMIEHLRKHAHAAIDISDGLVADLTHICKQSNLAAEIRITDTLFSPQAQKLLHKGTVTQEELLTGGDDYELVLAVPAAARVPGHTIGVFRPGPPQVAAFDVAGTPMAFSHKGWTHF